MAILTTPDGLTLHLEAWPVVDSKAGVVLVHGYGEHCGRYTHVAQALNNAGYSVTSFDHRMHGKSDGQPRAYVTDIETMVADLKQVWDKAKAEIGNKPMFLIGHSMGGAVVTRFTVQYQAEMQGLVTSGAAVLSSESLPAFLVTTVKAVSKFLPTLPTPKINSTYLSHDPQIPQQYDRDPLVYHGTMKLASIAALAHNGEVVLKQAPDLKLPILVLHGEADKVVPMQCSQVFYAKAGSADKTLKIYPGLYHEIFNELEKEMVLTTVINWLDAHLFARANK